MNQLNQTIQPLNDSETTALLSIAAGDMDTLRECTLSIIYPLLKRGYITRDKLAPNMLRFILTKAGRELIPTLFQHQAE